ncbi:mannose-P-dolichol utilization defect 1 protein [Phasianus colchicus]|uniref:mannose-P-dolichol utilization defect 1 protein n=1 Tax=Phasianus colchicus TaxID=9054 RepID=UPI00129E3BCC|nr:mannose-P-dolichol utilization defect 1 protein [Phasianus colchicus]
MEALRALLVPALLPEICFEAMRERPLHVKLPQLLKIYGARSGAGLSLGAVGLELLALGGSVAYSVGHGFPFSAWGEALFLLLQTLAIGFLILHYGGRTAGGERPTSAP